MVQVSGEGNSDHGPSLGVAPANRMPKKVRFANLPLKESGIGSVNPLLLTKY